MYKNERKLTKDWTKEIKPAEYQVTVSRLKGDRVAEIHPGYIQVEKPLITFPTGSSYEGKHNAVGFAGFGEYQFPHGAIYQGYFKDGQFHGDGTITYPKGQQIDGIWHNGRLQEYTFRFPDQLVYNNDWKYCELPDRSFQTEITEGLKPAGLEQLTNDVPTKPLKPNCFDTIDGYYDSKVKCVFNDMDEILRVVTSKEEQHILRNFRRYEDIPTGYRPDLYEYWTWGCAKDVEEILEDKESENEDEDTSDPNTTQENFVITLDKI